MKITETDLEPYTTGVSAVRLYNSTKLQPAWCFGLLKKVSFKESGELSVDLCPSAHAIRTECIGPRQFDPLVNERDSPMEETLIDNDSRTFTLIEPKKVTVEEFLVIRFKRALRDSPRRKLFELDKGNCILSKRACDLSAVERFLKKAHV